MSPTDTDLLTPGLTGTSCVWSYAEAGRGRGTAGKGGTFSDGVFSIAGVAPGGRGGGRLLACADLFEGSLIPRRRPVASRCLRSSGKDDFLTGPLNKMKTQYY